ncbi:MAG: energy transducer TonB, partial [Candidatus Zixiibacteriota bacterium]
PQLVAPTPLPYFRFERIVPFVVDIDKEGRVTAVSVEDQSDTAFERYARDWLKSIRFEPATFKGKKTRSRAPVILQYRPRVRLPEIHFPIDSNRVITDADLYFKVYGLNDIHLPMLDEFPSYFCELKWSDSLVIYKYVLVKIELDESGEVVNTELVRSTSPTYNTSIMSAILWADFSPAEMQGTPIASECYLLVSFFPYINYPTRVWRRTELDSLSLLGRFRMRLLPDTVGLMSKPLPAWTGGEKFSYSGPHQYLRDTVSAILYIDTSGHVKLGRMNNGSKQLQAVVREICRHLRFFPALDFQGQSCPYSGLTSFVFQGSTKIRIVCHWLHQLDSAT